MVGNYMRPLVKLQVNTFPFNIPNGFGLDYASNSFVYQEHLCVFEGRSYLFMLNLSK